MLHLKNNFAILINTTDRFEDCWDPFFKLFKKHWSEYDGKIYLNTEFKNFIYEDLKIIPIQNKAKKSTWSNCLKIALEKIEEDYILYMQEDYFFQRDVNYNEFNKYFNLFIKQKIACLQLTIEGTSGPFLGNKTESIWEVSKNAKYRVSTQVALWEKKKLISLICSWENGWQFEKYGSLRSKYSNLKIFSINQNTYAEKESYIFDYTLTGIIRGKWNPKVLPLFNQNKIDIDFSKRGFISEDGNSKTLYSRLQNKIMNPNTYKEILSVIDLLMKKIKYQFRINPHPNS